MSADKCKFVINVSDEGEMYIRGMENLKRFCSRFPGQLVHGVLTIERTQEQNRGLHLWFQIIGDETGEEDIETVKRTVKKKLGWYTEHVDEETGEIYREFESTASWGKRECSEKMEKMKIWAQQYLGITLPDLNPEKRKA